MANKRDQESESELKMANKKDRRIERLNIPQIEIPEHHEVTLVDLLSQFASVISKHPAACRFGDDLVRLSIGSERGAAHKR
jgi:hypothetical protein